MAKSFLQTIKNMINHNTAIIIIGILLIIIVLLFVYLPSSKCPAMRRYEYFADDKEGDNREEDNKDDEEKIAHKAAEKVISALAEFNKQQQEQAQDQEDGEFEEYELEEAAPAAAELVNTAPAPVAAPIVSAPSQLNIRTCNYLNARNGIVDRCDDVGGSCTRCKEGDFCLFGSHGNDQAGVYEGNLICKKGKWTDESPKNRK